MSKTKRKRYSAEFKAKVALEALKGEKTVAELATRFGIEDEEMSFSRSGDFNHDGVDDLALIGVFQDKDGKRGSFILILTKDRSGKWQKSFLEYLGKPAFAALSQNDPMEVWF